MAQRLVVCIGAQKAGTTWLADYFRAHPEVHMPPVKEVHYFDARFAPKWCAKYETEMLEAFKREVAALTLSTVPREDLQRKLSALLLRFRMIAEPRDYMRFMGWGAGAREVLFEATPDYSMLDEEGFRAMRAAGADVRLIFILRNPADRYWSALTFNATHNPAFEIDAMFPRLIDREDFRLLADYGRTIRAAMTAFSPTSIHVEFFEKLFGPDALGAICEYAGVAFAPADFARRANASVARLMSPERRAAAVRALGHVYRDVEALFGTKLPESWRRDLALL